MIRSILRLFKGTREPRDHGRPDATRGLLQVTADASRCVQCGICGFNCPVGIEVREYARRGENVTDSRCISCGACVEKCPRGTLKWGPAILIRPDSGLVTEPDALPRRMRLNAWDDS